MNPVIWRVIAVVVIFAGIGVFVVMNNSKQKKAELLSKLDTGESTFTTEDVSSRGKPVCAHLKEVQRRVSIYTVEYSTGLTGIEAVSPLTERADLLRSVEPRRVWVKGNIGNKIEILYADGKEVTIQSNYFSWEAANLRQEMIDTGKKSQAEIIEELVKEKKSDTQ